MPVAFTPAPILNHKSVGQTGSGHVAAPDRPTQLLESTELLQGNKAVGILHNGSLYRLQSTKLGKLILTK